MLLCFPCLYPPCAGAASTPGGTLPPLLVWLNASILVDIAARHDVRRKGPFSFRSNRRRLPAFADRGRAGQESFFPPLLCRAHPPGGRFLGCCRIDLTLPFLKFRFPRPFQSFFPAITRGWGFFCSFFFFLGGLVFLGLGGGGGGGGWVVFFLGFWFVGPTLPPLVRLRFRCVLVSPSLFFLENVTSRFDDRRAAPFLLRSTP